MIFPNSLWSFKPFRTATDRLVIINDGGNPFNLYPFPLIFFLMNTIERFEWRLITLGMSFSFTFLTEKEKKSNEREFDEFLQQMISHMLASFIHRQY